MADHADRTRPASDRKRREARQKGQVAQSAELASSLVLAAGLLVTALLLPVLLRHGHAAFGAALDRIRDPEHVTAETLLPEVGRMLVDTLRMGAPVLAATAVVAAGARLGQVGFLFTTKPLTPRLDHLDPIKGTKRLFSLKRGVMLAITLGKVALVLVVGTLHVMYRFPRILGLVRLDFGEAFVRAAGFVAEGAALILLILLLLGIIDWIYQKWQQERDLRMTEQEFRDDLKTTEGNPQIKQRQRGLARQRQQQRLTEVVPVADVVVTNPEHLAIALRWEEETMHAPVVLAKGADHAALRIRRIARAHGVPVLERKPLARAMYPLVREGESIPAEFYGAVAEILAWVYRVEGRTPRRRSGTRSSEARNLAGRQATGR